MGKSIIIENLDHLSKLDDGKKTPAKWAVLGCELIDALSGGGKAQSVVLKLNSIFDNHGLPIVPIGNAEYKRELDAFAIAMGINLLKY